MLTGFSHFFTLYFLASLSRDILKLTLSDYFEDKEENDVEELVKAAEQELNNGQTMETFQFENLFIEVLSYLANNKLVLRYE